MLPVLRSVVEPAGVRVVEADALRVDWSDLLGADGPVALVANLPYNVAVPLVVRVLEEAPQVDSLLVMVQREVGERLAAGPGDDAYAARLQVAVLHRQRDEMQSALAGEVELLDELVAEDAADAASTKTAKVAK